MMERRRLVLTLAALALAATGSAHKPSDSYLRVDGDSEAFAAEWDIAIRDLEVLVGLDANQDGQITWGELKSKRRAVAAHALSHLRVRAGDRPLRLGVTDLKVTQHSDGAYAVLLLGADGAAGPEPLRVEYDLLFDIDPTHRGLVLLRRGDAATTYVLGPDSGAVELDAAEASPWRSFVEYVGEGVWHIWIGFDHILFLITLLLPAVLVRDGQRWRGAGSLGAVCRGVLHLVTMFTLAHSITLWLAVMRYVTLPSQWVEATIAASILVTSAAAVFPKLPVAGWKVAFLFGLIHGFGFANVLVDLGLSSASLGIALLGFNLGVEVGQLAIVLVFLPVAYALRNTVFYRKGVLFGGSAVIALVAAIWLYERLFNAEILGF